MTIREARQRARDEFAYRLLAAYPNPQHSTRRQVDPLFDSWWPDTVPSPSEKAGKPVGPDLDEQLAGSIELAARRRLRAVEEG